MFAPGDEALERLDGVSEQAVTAIRAPGKALVMGDDTRGFLATVRSLGRQGVEVHAAPFDFRSPALRSRYVRAVHDVPPFMEDGERWLGALRAVIAAERYDLVIPCDERNLLPLQRHRAAFEGLTRLAIPSDEAIAALFDKHATRELARRVGVTVARGRLMQAGDGAEALLAEFGAPIVVKPRRSYTMDGLAKRGRVHVVGDAETLARVLREVEPDETIFEACFEGSGLGVSVLASGGRLLQAFEHHRVHERSGSSFYRVSAAPDPALVEACAAIAAGVAFTGIAMFEFKRNAAGAWVLLEVNARPWGSLPLPVALGVDFPWRWYRLLVEGVETGPVPYRVGVHGRNTVPDLVAALSEPGKVGAWLGAARRAAAATSALVGAERNDVWVGDDRAPGRTELQGLGRSGLDRAWRRMPWAAAAERRRAWRIVRAAARRRPCRVLFVCQGNICRSPYAAAVLAEIGGPEVEAVSAGTMLRPGRPTPALFVATAAAEGIDLGAHRSRWLDRQSVEQADLIVAFDRVNCQAIGERYAGALGRVITLGALIGVGEIADPVDGDAATAAASYALVRRGVAALAQGLAPLPGQAARP